MQYFAKKNDGDEFGAERSESIGEIDPDSIVFEVGSEFFKKSDDSEDATALDDMVFDKTQEDDYADTSYSSFMEKNFNSAVGKTTSSTSGKQNRTDTSGFWN